MKAMHPLYETFNPLLIEDPAHAGQSFRIVGIIPADPNAEDPALHYVIELANGVVLEVQDNEVFDYSAVQSGYVSVLER